MPMAKDHGSIFCTAGSSSTWGARVQMRYLPSFPLKCEYFAHKMLVENLTGRWVGFFLRMNICTVKVTSLFITERRWLYQLVSVFSKALKGQDPLKAE